MYRAPVETILAAMRFAAGPGGLDEELTAAVLEEAGRFAAAAVAPVAAAGDRHGARFAGGAVTMPPGWADLYREWREGGWNGLSAPEAFGGQGLSVALGTAVMEMWNSGAIAFALMPTLTAGAVEAISAHASDALKALYLPKLVSGEWTGTMNLTEPQAGSDVGALSTRAAKAGDGTFRLFGQKIFITYGEHDMAANIVHLVLARVEGAPAGSRGVSLFLVPKFLADAEGSPAVRNDVACGGIERKLGIHASPTCTMLFGTGAGETGEAGAVGWLVGEENRGLNAMFTMMNSARLAVGIQGVGVAEAALQKALHFAAERRQGRTATSDGSAPILHHPDVQRMLLTMKALTGAARAICYACANAIDGSRTGDDAAFWKMRADLLTPVAKAFATDIGVEVANLGIQVHGGMGFVEETGAARLLRDARIAPIYEGTNGIQAIDLALRKLPMQGGNAVGGLLDEIGTVAGRLRAGGRPAMGRTGEALEAALLACRQATAFLREAAADGRQDAVLFGATPYLRLFGLTLGGALLAGEALDAADGEAKAALAGFFAEACLPETGGLAGQVLDGGKAAAAAAKTLLPA